jgi:NAD(P)-dependent dehydrogenase (short-subunit alcohol dehydrogenase family)
MTTQKHLTIMTGASRGMGLAMARQLLTEGHSLLCISRQSSEALAAHTLSLGGSLVQWQRDLSDSLALGEELKSWLLSIEDDNWASVSLINNAGTIAGISPLQNAGGADLCRALRVGLEAPMVLSAAFLGATKNWRIPRKLLNISSGLGRRAMASQSAYCAAKAGMDHFTRCVALEEASAPHGAKVCSLAPGVIDTDMQQHLRSADPAAFADIEAFKNLKHSGSLATTQEAAASVLSYLARPDFGTNPVGDIRDK